MIEYRVAGFFGFDLVYEAKHKDYDAAYADYVVASYRTDITNVRLIKRVTNAEILEQLNFNR